MRPVAVAVPVEEEGLMTKRSSGSSLAAGGGGREVMVKGWLLELVRGPRPRKRMKRCWPADQVRSMGMGLRAVRAGRRGMVRVKREEVASGVRWAVWWVP